MTNGQHIVAIEELKDGEVIEKSIQGETETHSLVLARIGEAIHVYRNVCPHQGRPLNWAPGRLLISDEGYLVCPAHGAAFELIHGTCVKGVCQGSSLVPVPVKSVEGDIQIDLQ